MKYHQLPNKLFIKNRKNFMKAMKGNSCAVFNSNDIYPTSADGSLAFRQHSDILFLSGADQEESILVLSPNASNPKHREILFLKETNEHIAIWEGEKYSKKQATSVSGVETIYWLNQFDTIFKQIMGEADTLYINTNEHLRANNDVQTREDRFIVEIIKKYPAHALAKSAPILHKLRSIKDSIEIDLIKQACDITEKGFRRLLKFVKPGIEEFQIEAELMHEFLNNRSNGFAYTPIVASGRNACVLHYIQNNQPCQKGDVILLDVGAEYANYASDMTRCLPVGGKFSPRQKAVYNSVLHVKNEAQKMLVPGTILADYHKEVGKLMEKELIKLKLIDKTDIKNQNKDWPAYKKYFMHGTSHFLGLDVHDVGLWHEPIKENMVFTCEPGIYILEENLGIRLEDDLVVKSKKPLNLMANIPIEADEIESLMNEK